MNDTGTLILIGIIVVAVVLLMQRFMGRQNNWGQPGNEYPHTDNPNVSSHGGFGGQPQRPQRQNRQYDDPNVSSHGGFGRGSTTSMAQGRREKVVNESERRDFPSMQRTPEKSPERTRRNDDPDVNSHGGFGRS